MKNFKHSNIAGNHVGGGRFYRGYRCKANTGCFADYNDKYVFAYDDYAHVIDSAALYKGMAFGQSLILHNGNRMKTVVPKKLSSKNEYRALCNYDNRLCVIDSQMMPYAEFVDLLVAIGVNDAIYMDMGKGWNCSWYRISNDSVRFIHSQKTPYATNWIVFKRNI